MPTRDARKSATDYLQGALVAIDNATGAMRAIVGGRDYSESPYSRALLAERPPGSTFKPFVYAAAFERGLLPGTLVDDSKIAENEFRNISNGWSPDNSDDEYMGFQPAAVGLVKSRNTMSVRVGESVGLPQVRELARKAGVATDIPDLPGIFLGAFETTLKDLTAAYTIFPNLGWRPEPHLIDKVTDRDGQVLFSAASRGRRVLDSGTAWLVSKLLQQVLVSGTAANARRLGWNKPAGGKTGTTNDCFDAWFVGYTSSLTCGVWTGFDKPQTIGPKAYGSALALPIWVDFMNHARKENTPPVRCAIRPTCKKSRFAKSPACAPPGPAPRKARLTRRSFPRRKFPQPYAARISRLLRGSPTPISFPRRSPSRQFLFLNPFRLPPFLRPLRANRWTPVRPAPRKLPLRASRAPPDIRESFPFPTSETPMRRRRHRFRNRRLSRHIQSPTHPPRCGARPPCRQLPRGRRKPFKSSRAATARREK